MWNGTMFVDLDWPLNASSLLSASAELLVRIIGRLLLASLCRSTIPTRRLQMILKKQYTVHLTPNLNPADIMFGRDTRRFSWKLRPKPKTAFELKVALEKTWENFLQNKAVPSFRKRFNLIYLLWKSYTQYIIRKVKRKTNAKVKKN